MALSARTQALVGMLGSPNDGEALAAARKLAGALKAEGMDFHDLARGVKPAPGRAPPPPPPPKGWRADREALMALGEKAFTARQWEFLERLEDWRGALTERQAAWLADLKKKAGL